MEWYEILLVSIFLFAFILFLAMLCYCAYIESVSKNKLMERQAKLFKEIETYFKHKNDKE